ncbi:hypothetical protein B9G69_003730 [Bdellovibrio sp. SKB1291214]|uniref:hypothetical protein n=1 Tax=Bdellovibrio sp. SKB1291214 TaxID=1732569 RepID=UPI000B7458D8|nr:hypothetical protein [Bdellovibrio sp. SKB1291214]UYL09683.1 hypothetical protein B9G69_003730 [Bdellovibrio sp. SKB1291214]
MRMLLCCLMLGLTFLKYGSQVANEFASTSPRALWSGREGVYTLKGGADDCPTQMTWFEQCDGFVLNPQGSALDMETIRFCHINKGARTVQRHDGKITAKVDTKDHYVLKVEKSVFANYSLPMGEDIVIMDKDRSGFNLERSKAGMGLTCVYSKL